MRAGTRVFCILTTASLFAAFIPHCSADINRFQHLEEGTPGQGTTTVCLFEDTVVVSELPDENVIYFVLLRLKLSVWGDDACDESFTKGIDFHSKMTAPGAFNDEISVKYRSKHDGWCDVYFSMRDPYSVHSALQCLLPQGADAGFFNCVRIDRFLVHFIGLSSLG